RIASESGWLSENPTSGTVPPGDSLQVWAVANTSGLMDGNYLARVVVNSNDPVSPELGSPVVSLQVGQGGIPVISVTPDSVEFDTVFVGFDSTQSITVGNAGSDTLNIWAIIVTNSAFSVNTSLFTLAPGANQTVQVTFTPPSIGDYTGLLRIVSNDPASDTTDVYVSGTGAQITGIADRVGIPTTFDVSPNYPNPFNPTTTIKYQLPQSSDVKLVIYNVLGQAVRTLLNRQVEAGYHSVVWDGRNEAGQQVSSGIYIYRFSAGDFSKIQKMILMK
ncbi:MAG: choice-of-anchor D domain-containing protein, partial [Calditrichia bacterium]